MEENLARNVDISTSDSLKFLTNSRSEWSPGRLIEYQFYLFSFKIDFNIDFVSLFIEII